MLNFFLLLDRTDMQFPCQTPITVSQDLFSISILILSEVDNKKFTGLLWFVDGFEAALF